MRHVSLLLVLALTHVQATLASVEDGGGSDAVCDAASGRGCGGVQGAEDATGGGQSVVAAPKISEEALRKMDRTSLRKLFSVPPKQLPQMSALAKDELLAYVLEPLRDRLIKMLKPISDLQEEG